MKQYLSLLRDVIDNGVRTDDRTGVGTLSVFGRQVRYDLSQGFPLVTTKRVHFKSVVHELLWFLKGDTNVKYLQDNGVKIWNEWADANGDLGPVYGKQWRSWSTPDGGHIDQITNVIEEIKRNPSSRRLIVNAWNVADVGEMAIPPCHTMFQFNVSRGKLSCQLYQRSGDCFLGVPYNVASYAILTHMIAQICDLRVGEFVHTLGDAHIYTNHLSQVNQQLSREPQKLPRLKLYQDIRDIDDFQYEHIKLVGYEPLSSIKASVAV